MNGNTKSKFNKKIFTFALTVLLTLVSLCGCREEGNGGASNLPKKSAEPSSSGTSEFTEPEYLYEEFVNTQQPDFGVLGQEEGTREEAEQVGREIEKVEDELHDVDEKYKTEGTVEEDEIDLYLDEALKSVQKLYENGDIAGYEAGEDSIEVQLNSGVIYIIAPQVEGRDAGTGGTKLQVATYQPFRTVSIVEDGNPEELLERLDMAARTVSDAIEQYEYFQNGSNTDNDMEDDEVTLESVLRIPNYNLIFWHGHGNYSPTEGPVLALGTRYTLKSNMKYMGDLQKGRLVCIGGYYAITGKFIEKYIPDGALKNNIIYLGACHSGEDKRLSEAFLSKGAAAVYANSGTIDRAYNLSMIRTVAEGLTKQWGDGRYYTVEEALAFAKQQNGEYDRFGTEAVLYQNSNVGKVALDWYEDHVKTERDVVMVLDRSGSMAGEPLEQTKEAACRFVDTVLEQDARTAVMTYSDDVQLANDFGRRGVQLKESINTVNAGNGTNIYDAVAEADAKLDMSQAEKKIMLLMTDGQPNGGKQLNGSYEEALIQYCENMKQKGYYVYTLGFFSDLGDGERAVSQRMLQNMASPGCHYEVKNAGDLVYFFDDIAMQIGGEDYVYIRIACPVDVTVSRDGETLSSVATDQNTRTSFGSLTFEGESDEIKVLRLKSDEIYDVELNGTDKGTMDYTIGFMDENGEYTDQRTFIQVPVTEKTSIDTDTDGDGSTVLEVDSDGDGETDKTYEAQAGGEGKEVETKKTWSRYAVIAGIVIVVVAIILIVAIVAVRRKKKNGMADQNIQQNTQHYVTPVFMPGLLCIQGEYQGGMFEIPVSSTVSIGRDKDCNIVLNHEKISRLHCMVFAAPEGSYQVMDYSSNGTYVNGTLIQKGVPFHAVSGQNIAIGKSGNIFQLN